MASFKAHTIRQFLKLRAQRQDPNQPIAQRRQELDLASEMFLMPENINIQQVMLQNMESEWLEIPGADEHEAMLYLHGGGYTAGSCQSYRFLASQVGLACRLNVLLPEYRLAPEHPFPAAVEDAVTAYHWLLASGIPPGGIVIAGDSAGGGLAMAALTRIRDTGVEMPAAAVLLSPWLDLTMSGETIKTCAEVDPSMNIALLRRMANFYRGGTDASHPQISPLFADLNGLPAILIQVGEDEILLSDSTRLAENAASAGIDITLDIYDEMWHVWHYFGDTLPESQQAIEKIGTFVRNKL